MSRKRANPKPRFKTDTDEGVLKRLATQVRYSGNPAHKKHAGDFGLTPPTSPRSDKTLCDGAGILTKEHALKLLREGILKGMISDQERNGFPQQVWAVSENGVALEAQLDNQEQGTYHGYPLLPFSPLWHKVIKRWNENKQPK